MQGDMGAVGRRSGRVGPRRVRASSRVDNRGAEACRAQVMLDESSCRVAPEPAPSGLGTSALASVDSPFPGPAVPPDAGSTLNRTASGMWVAELSRTLLTQGWLSSTPVPLAPGSTAAAAAAVAAAAKAGVEGQVQVQVLQVQPLLLRVHLVRLSVEWGDSSAHPEARYSRWGAGGVGGWLKGGALKVERMGGWWLGPGRG